MKKSSNILLFIVFVFCIVVFSNLTLKAQNFKSFTIDNLIYINEATPGDAHDFLKSRYFTFVKKYSDYNLYGLNYNNVEETAKLWCAKYFDGKVEIKDSKDGEFVMNIKENITPFKKKTDFKENGVVEVLYYYKKNNILIREDDQTSTYYLKIFK